MYTQKIKQNKQTKKEKTEQKVEIPPQILLFLKLCNGEMSSLWQVVFKNKQTNKMPI